MNRQNGRATENQSCVYITKHEKYLYAYALARTHTKCMQVLFVSIFIFSRTVSSLMVMWLVLVLLLQLLNYIYSFYINLSFNDVNDFIFRHFFLFFYRPCTLLNINPIVYFLHVLTGFSLLFSCCWSLGYAFVYLSVRSFSFLFPALSHALIVLRAFSLFFSFVLSPIPSSGLFFFFSSSSFLHNTWFFCKYSIYRNWLVDE